MFHASSEHCFEQITKLHQMRKCLPLRFEPDQQIDATVRMRGVTAHRSEHGKAFDAK